MVTADQTCMTQLGKTTITEATVRQTKCDATDGPKVSLKPKQFLNFFHQLFFIFKLWECIKGTFKSKPTGTPPTTPTGAGAVAGGSGPHSKYHAYHV
jgi:hypothetical protein